MKIQSLITASLLAGIGLWAGSARAQVGGVRASVPFPFTVSGKTFAPGEYTMVAGSNQVRVISPADGRTIAMALANDVSGHLAGANGRVVFRCYAEQCFLAEVWSPTEMNGRQVLTPRAESDARKEHRGTYFAILGMKPKQ
jgi:hypothetical protein